MEITPKERTTSGRRFRVTTPSFPDCAVMDEFYAEAHRLIEAHFDSERERGSRALLFADFTAAKQDGALVIELYLRARENGRTVGERRVAHVWQDGNIAPGHKSPITIISKIVRKHKRKRKKAHANEAAAKKH